MHRRWSPKDARECMEARSVLKSLGMKTMGVKRTYGAPDSVLREHFMSLSSNTKLEEVNQLTLVAGSSIW